MKTTCPYCGVGCGVAARGSVDALEIAGDDDHPANRGKLCIKGATLAETLDDSARLLRPRIGRRDASWPEALDLIAARFGETIAEHGPDSVAFYVSGQFLTEDYYVANKLMKGFIGSGNIDTNSRLCMASSVAGHVRAFGEDIVPCCYEDIDEADLLILVGSNAAWCHPVLFQRALAARERRGAKIVVIDPRATATAALADLHISIGPDCDVALFGALLAEAAAAGALDQGYIDTHTTGFDAALSAARHVDLAAMGVDRNAFDSLLALVLATPRMVTLFSQGVNQSAGGTDKVNAIINLHFALGRIGKPGAGPFSLTGQPNAMGGREVGGLANQLAAHMGFDEPSHHAAITAFWGAPNLARRPGLKAVDLFEAVLSGRIKALWIAGTNPAESMPRADRVRAALEAGPFVVVSDCWETETTRRAGVVLPAAGWGEKDGTVTNSERMISRQRPFRRAPGEARPDWWMFVEVARRMGFGAAFDWNTPAAIFREHAALSAFHNKGARRFDLGALAAIDDAAYEALKPFRWGPPRLFGAGGFPTRDGRGRFVPVTPPQPVTDRAFPFKLNTGRLRDQWHTMTRTGAVPRLMESAPVPALAIAPEDTTRLGASAGDLARVSTRAGSTILPIEIVAGQRAGTIFAAMHWTGAHTGSDSISRLVGLGRDPLSGQPAAKHEPASVEVLPVLWHGILRSRTRLALAGSFHWSRVPLTGGGHMVRLAGWKPLPPADALGPWAARLVGSERGASVELLELADSARGIVRVALLRGDRLEAVLFIGPVRSALPYPMQIASLFAIPRPREAGIALLRPGVPPTADAGRIVCVCHRVSESSILTAIRAGGCDNVVSIGRLTGAGTNCGSCKGEIAALLAAEPRQELAYATAE